MESTSRAAAAAARRLVLGSQGDAATQAALAEQARTFGFSAPVGVTSRRDPPPPPAPLGERIFISTEDPEALARLVGAGPCCCLQEPPRSYQLFLLSRRSAGPSYGWDVLFSRFPRLNEGPASQMESAGPGAVRLTRSHLGQLLLALEADAWVGESSTALLVGTGTLLLPGVQALMRRTGTALLMSSARCGCPRPRGRTLRWGTCTTTKCGRQPPVATEGGGDSKRSAFGLCF